MQTNAILTATSTAGKKISTTITYLRPEQKSHASELAIALNALTTNTYVSTQINEMNIDPTSGKQDPSVTTAANLRLEQTIYFLDIIASDIPVENICLTGNYLDGSANHPVFQTSTMTPIQPPAGVLATYLVATQSAYNSAANKQFALVASETANYNALYLDVTNITP